MAVLVALGGAALGSAIGVGPQVGWLIGSVIGNLLFPPSGPDTVTEGPRLGDLTVTSSAYGTSIPIGYGTIRMAGNIIWSSGIEEVQNVNKQKTGGKGGGGSTQTSITYSYFATFALAFSEGVAEDVLRMWADGKLIYDKTGLTDDIIKIGLKFRFYPGDETQEPDGLVEVVQGVNQTPAWRGLCYLVFDRMPLRDFGNRIPNITAEITYKARDAKNEVVADLFTVGEGGLAASFQADELRPDFTRGVFYTVQQSVAVGSNILRRFNTRTMKEDRQSSITEDALTNSVNFLNLQVILPNGFLLAMTNSTNTRPLSTIDPNTLDIVSTFGVASAGLNNDPLGFELLAQGRSAYMEAVGPNGNVSYALTASQFNSVGVLEVEDDGTITYVWDSDTDPAVSIADARIIGCCPGAVGVGFAEGYFVTGSAYGSASSDAINVYRITVQSGAFFDTPADVTIGVDVELMANFTVAELVPGETTLDDVKGPIYDETDDTIMIQAQGTSDGQGYMLKITPAIGGQAPIAWRSKVPDIRNGTGGFSHSRLLDGVYGQMDVDTSFALYTATGEVFQQLTGWPSSYLTSGAQWWDSRGMYALGHSSTTGTPVKWLFFRGAGDGAGLDEIVSDLCGRVGLLPSDIDVTDLAGQTVPGFVIGRQTTARGAIEQLAAVYYFDGVESDYVLKFTLRDGKSSVVTIPQRDLAPLSGTSGEFFREARVQEVELPHRYTIVYMDKDNDYLQQAHSARRILGPTSAMSSRNEVSLTIAAALSSDFVKQAAEMALYTSWIERSNFAVMLPWKYLVLDPSDIVTIELDDGTSFRTRLVQTDVGLNFMIDVGALSEDVAQYTSAVLSDGGDSGLTQEFLSDTITKLLLLCTPLLRDSDDVGRTVSRFYFAMGGYGQPGWTAGTLFKSAENTEWAPAGSITEEMSWGAVGNALGSTPDPFETDETNTLTVFMNTGIDNLVSVTQLEMVNGANPAALVHADGTVEVLQFRDVTVNADTSRTLSGLLRGRRGTDVFVGGHAAGDIFVLLNPSTVDLVSLTLGEVGSTRFYKGITSGQLFEDAPTTTKVSAGNDLKPYHPASHGVTIDGGNDLTLTWVRRTRVGGQLQDGSGIVPLSEDSEEYEVDILDAPGGSVVRTFTGLSSPTVTYTSANQTSDGFSPPLTQLTFKVFQVSAQVGRGFTLEVTADVV